MLRLQLFISALSFFFLLGGSVLNIVRLAFQCSNLSIYFYIFLPLLSSLLALSAKCTIFIVETNLPVVGGKCFLYNENATKSTVIKQPATIKSPQIERMTIKGLAQHDLKLN